MQSTFMHYKEFQDHFYQNPSFTYSQISQNLLENRKPVKYYENICSNRSRRTCRGSQEGRCQGKYLKHIFNALKNKTSSELATFINLNSVTNEVKYDISSISFLSEYPRNLVPLETFKTYTVNGTNRKQRPGSRTDDYDSEEDMSSELQMGGSTDSDMTQSFESDVNRNEKNVSKQVVDQDFEAEKKYYQRYSINDSENKEKYHPYKEVYEDKPTEKICLIQKVFSLFKTKNKKDETCSCNLSHQQTEDPIKKEPSWVKPIFENSKCKCSETIIKLDKGKCNTLNRYKCNKCGKIDLDKFESRCPKLKIEEETLMFLLRVEAKQNFKEIKVIQKELKEQNKIIIDLNKKYSTLLGLLDPKRISNVTDASTDTIGATKDKGVETKTEVSVTAMTDPSKTDSCPCAIKKKASFFARIFKKAKCDQSCKCCLVEKPDKGQCKYYLDKKKKKKPKKEKTDKTDKSVKDEKKNDEKKKKDEDKKEKNENKKSNNDVLLDSNQKK